MNAHELEGKRLIAASVGRRILEARAEKVNRKLDIAFDTVNPATAIELLLINPECIFIAPSTVLDLYPGALTRKVPLRGLGECAWVFAWKKKAELSQLTRDYLAFMRKYPPRMFIEEAFNRKIRSAKHRQM